MYLNREFNRMAAAVCVAAATALVFGGAASAGDCPADQVMAGAVTSGETEAVGVTDTVLASIDLSSKGGSFDGQLLRMRQLTIEPGGVVPWHEHSVRPASIYILSGTINEYRSTCKVPVAHKAGEVTSEFGADLAHWWKNTGSEPVVLIAADVFAPAMASPEMQDPDMM
jgi:quercetin dioxygenase-like cupin family protein